MLIFLLFAVVVAFFILRQIRIISLENQALVASKTENLDIAEKKLTILAFGDIMLDRNVYLAVKKAGDFNFPFLKIDSLLRGADLRIANLEGPITDFDSVSIGNTRMRFTISPQFLEPLKTRFDVLSLANNHILDFGEIGYAQTKEKLGSAGIGYFGDYKNRKENLAKIIEKNGIKIGWVGYHGLADKNLSEVADEIKTIKSQSDFVVVFAHWGAEYAQEPSESQKQEARLFIDSGADLIIGSHSHVVQSSEKYQGKKIFYSLGNFIFDQYFSEETMKGLGVEILLRKSNNGIKADYKEYPLIINKNSQPELAE